MVLPPAGEVVRGAVLGCEVVVVPEVTPPMFVVGEVFPIGGVVPGVVLGVVAGVVLGVVPVVVFGVIPGVVLGIVVVVGAVLVLGTLLGVDGGQIVLPVEVLGEEPGMVALGLVPDGLDVLDMGADDAVEGDPVEVTGQVTVGGDTGLTVEPGVVLCTPLVLVDCEPGTVGVGVIAPVDVCAVAMPTARHRTAAIRIARVVIHISPVGIHRWDVDA